jgi:hypothetical protein
MTGRERLGPDLIHVVAARRLTPDDLPGAFDAVGGVDTFALVADPEHGGSTGGWCRSRNTMSLAVPEDQVELPPWFDISCWSRQRPDPAHIRSYLSLEADSRATVPTIGVKTILPAVSPPEREITLAHSGSRFSAENRPCSFSSNWTRQIIDSSSLPCGNCCHRRGGVEFLEPLSG